MRAATIIAMLVVMGSSCNNFICGELTGEWKTQLENAKAHAANLKIENTPCEFYYINVTATSKKIDTSAIHSIHKYLYNEKNNIGWQVALVYDVEGKYLFSHRYNDSIYIQKVD
jgi:hypothetical protein